MARHLLLYLAAGGLIGAGALGCATSSDPPQPTTSPSSPSESQAAGAAEAAASVIPASDASKGDASGTPDPATAGSVPGSEAPAPSTAGSAADAAPPPSQSGASPSPTPSAASQADASASGEGESGSTASSGESSDGSETSSSAQGAQTAGAAGGGLPSTESGNLVTRVLRAIAEALGGGPKQGASSSGGESGAEAASRGGAETTSSGQASAGEAGRSEAGSTGTGTEGTSSGAAAGEMGKADVGSDASGDSKEQGSSGHEQTPEGDQGPGGGGTGQEIPAELLEAFKKGAARGSVSDRQREILEELSEYGGVVDRAILSEQEIAIARRGDRAEGSSGAEATGSGDIDGGPTEGGQSDQERYGSVGAGHRAATGPRNPPPPDVGDGSNDDVFAAQLRELAMNEPDPERQERYWDEYRKYKNSIK